MKYFNAYNITFTVDEDYPDKIEISMTDDDGVVVEGGQFDLHEFMQHVMKFYNDRY
jgi:hypothetical protein